MLDIKVSLLNVNSFKISPRVLTRHSSDSAFSHLIKALWKKQIIGIRRVMQSELSTLIVNFRLESSTLNDWYTVCILCSSRRIQYFATDFMITINRRIKLFACSYQCITMCITNTFTFSSSVILPLQHQNYKLNTQSYLFYLEYSLPCLLPVLNLHKSSL